MSVNQVLNVRVRIKLQQKPNILPLRLIFFSAENQKIHFSIPNISNEKRKQNQSMLREK